MEFPGPTAASQAERAVVSGKSLLASIGGVTLILLFCKLAGFSEKLVIAHYLGTSSEADAYYAAFAVVWTVVFVVRELVQPALLPVYVETLRADELLARRVLAVVGFGVTAALIVLAAMLFVWPEAAARAVAPGFEPDVHARTASLLQAMSGGIVLLALMGLTRTVLNAHGEFCWAAAGELLFRVVVIGGLAAGFIAYGVNRIGWALTAAAVAGLALHLGILHRRTGICLAGLDRRVITPLRQVTILAAPLVIGVLCSHVGQLIDGVMASALSPGRVSALTYARKLTDAVVLLGPAALATVMFAHFASLAAAGRSDEMRRLFVRCVRIVLIASVGVALLLVVLNQPVVRILFQHGRFNAESASLTSSALVGYGAGIPAFAVDGLIVGTLYAMKDVRTPVLVGIVGVMADIILAWVLMRYLDHVGIAVSIATVKTLKSAVLLWIVGRRLGIGLRANLGGLCSRLFAAGVVAVAATLAGSSALHATMTGSGWAEEVVRLILTSAFGATAFVSVLWFLNVSEAREALTRLFPRRRRRVG